MKLHQLKALAAVAETGSILEASHTLHVTQSALSKTLKELEKYVGVTLFIRSSKGVQLTEYGQRLVTHARLIGQNVRRAREDIEEMKGNFVGEIHIGVTPVAARLSPLADCLAAFRLHYPHVRLCAMEMRHVQMVEEVREGRLDFALTSQGLPPDGALDSTQVLRMTMAVAGRNGHPRREERSLRALHQEEWLALDPLTDSNTPFVQLFEGHGLELPKRVIECSSMALALAMCMRTDAMMVLATASRYWLDMLDFLDIEDRLPERVITLVTRDRHTLTESASRLYDTLADALQRFPASCAALKRNQPPVVIGAPL